VHLDLDLDRIRDTLIRREAELREDAERMGLDFGLQGVLEHFRGRIQQRLADLPATHHELEDRLRNIYAALDDFKDFSDPDQLSSARMALKRGATGKTAALLKRAQSLGNQQVAEASGSQLAVARNKKLAAWAAFLLGQLAETDFNYFAATQHYQLAAELQPANLTYLKAAAELSYAFEEFQETGHLLEQVLKIQEKLLGPEHLDLAQTLNNLGVLRHTQGRQAEAEAFYLWALEICDAQGNPQDQDAVNLRQNYAAFLQESAEFLGKPWLNEASMEMTGIGDAWREFAYEAGRYFKNRDNGTISYESLADRLVRIADREEKLFGQLRSGRL
jgi:tetratricopeptide (TPR) repeat protein